MTLARKLTLRIAALVIAVVLIAGAALFGLLRLERSTESAERSHEKLQHVYKAGHHAATIQTLLLVGADAGSIERESKNGFWALMTARRIIEAESDAAQLAAIESVYARWSEAIDLPQTQQHAAFNRVLNEIATLTSRITASLEAHRRRADAQVATTITLIASVAAVTLLAAVFIAASTYRGVMRPLRALDRAMARVAEARFSDRIEPASERELARLAERFNDMADRLDTLYRTLEAEVNTKSRALVRSERLAGVGYLAAGLAHEINNPLGIIGGYAEAALNAHGDADRIEKALRVIADEAFRCKQITGKLLSLARPNDTAPARVALRPIVERAVDMLSSMPRFTRRGVRVEIDPAAQDAAVLGHEGELMQVLVNLLANALEAVQDDHGLVTVSLAARGPWVQLRIADNGRGMTAPTLARVFEPFFTDAPQRDRPGTGLGLAVTHAIVAQHGGRITAESAGEGCGSAFTVQLPPADDR